MQTNSRSSISPENGQVWCVIPVYNNAATIRSVAEGCRKQLANVLVVDDGSSDARVGDLLKGLDVTVVRHDTNRGKGAALLTGIRYVKEHGGEWAICIDGDGQHLPEDIGAFLPILDQHPNSILIGARDFSVPNIPDGSRFGRKFSNFWVRLETGVKVADSQSGFRAYPVGLITQIPFRGNHYDFEIEILAKGSWYGLKLVDVPIHVYYPPREERVSHFDKVKDNALITHRHGMLISRRLLPWPHRRLVPYPTTDWRNLVRHPLAFITMLLRERSTPGELAMATAVGVFLGVLPLVGLHTVLILYVTTKLKLNRLLALNIQHLCAPPLVPLLCIEVGFYIRHGSWIGYETLRNFASELHQHLFNWILGSLLVAPLFAVIFSLVTFGLAKLMQNRRHAARTP